MAKKHALPHIASGYHPKKEQLMSVTTISSQKVIVSQNSYKRIQKVIITQECDNYRKLTSKRDSLIRDSYPRKYQNLLKGTGNKRKRQIIKQR